MKEQHSKLSRHFSEDTAPGNHRTFLGHQSVGLNILDGIRSVYPSIRVFDVRESRFRADEPGIYHKRIGKNRDPHSKIDDFANIVEQYHDQFDIAAMKLCYVDIDKHTDTTDLFRYYKLMVDKLASSVKDVRLLHITVPLRCVRLGIRSTLKLFSGRSIDNLDDNIRRDHYNSLMRAEFLEHALFFDLAALEAVSPDGASSAVKYRKQMVPNLYAGYTSDGGHLNDVGKHRIAKAFIHLLADAKSK